ncbi:PIR Superfamily Protein [Plasmodium ovale curtisi]|uniref:PIR Superfamily Protein n=1 Tax=Plasmodium ovale curtisi TaxID=864141 RepID=A0A1A8X7N7_PLAOA|nr:PIR Superfamily Protein [Plasmodium ovale curtisi]
MATVHVVSISSPDKSRRDKCISVLSDIQSTVTTKIAELHSTEEEDEKFVKICQYLGDYLDFYEEGIEECYENGFSYLYETIISLLKDELSKSPKYKKCIQKLASEEKEHHNPKYEENDLLKEENPFKDAIIKLQKEIKEIFKKSENSLDTEHLTTQELLEVDQKNDYTREAEDIQVPSESLQGITTSPNATGTISETSQIMDVGRDSQKTQMIEARVESTSNNIVDAGTGVQKSDLLQSSSHTTSDRQDVVNVPNLKNSGLSTPESFPSHELESITEKKSCNEEETSSVEDPAKCQRSGSFEPADTEKLSHIQKTGDINQPLKPSSEEQASTGSTSHTNLFQSSDAIQEHRNKAELQIHENHNEQITRNSQIITNVDEDISLINTYTDSTIPSTPAEEPVFTTLGRRFSKKKKKKRQEIQEELERIMYSPSNFNENNMYLSYAHLED